MSRRERPPPERLEEPERRDDEEPPLRDRWPERESDVRRRRRPQDPREEALEPDSESSEDGSSDASRPERERSVRQETRPFLPARRWGEAEELPELTSRRRALRERRPVGLRERRRLSRREERVSSRSSSGLSTERLRRRRSLRSGEADAERLGEDPLPLPLSRDRRSRLSALRSFLEELSFLDEGFVFFFLVGDSPPAMYACARRMGRENAEMSGGLLLG
jgi:hypothetical protein